MENLVGWVKGSFFKVRRFHDREDLERQLIAWLAEVNTQRPSRATNEIPADRMKAERERLTPLAIPAAEYPLRITTMVRTTGFVEYERIRYSMPPNTIGIPGTLFLYPDRVRIVTRNGTEAEHPRHPAVGEGLLPYVQPHVLVIDEVGYLTYSADAANVLFQVVDHRYLHKKPMLFTTNKPLSQWGWVLHDPDLAEAITDRVLERGRFIQLRGPSYRTRHLVGAEQRGEDGPEHAQKGGDQACC